MLMLCAVRHSNHLSFACLTRGSVLLCESHSVLCLILYDIILEPRVLS